MTGTREMIYRPAEDINTGDETRKGIIAGVIENDDNTITFLYHGIACERVHRFKPMEIYVK